MREPSADTGRPSEPLAADVLPLVYDELRRLAARFLDHERSGHTLQPTALVNEAFLQLAGRGDVRVESRSHVLALAARAMRRILVDSARRRGAVKRGGGLDRLSLSGALGEGAPQSFDVLDLDQALARLAAEHPRPAQVVELRFFGGLEVKETAQVLGVSASTVMADWRFARAWLGQALGPAP